MHLERRNAARGQLGGTRAAWCASQAIGNNAIVVFLVEVHGPTKLILGGTEGALLRLMHRFHFF